jgi:hypothetical protein
MCHWWVDMPNNGTSNATTKTITGPYAAASAGIQRALLTVAVDAGSATEGRIESSVGSNIFTLLKAPGGAATTWTNSGNCRASFYIAYEIAV